MSQISVKIDTNTGAVEVVDPDGKPIPGKPVDPSKPIPIAGKIDYLNTLVYYKQNPTCIVINGVIFCY